MSSLVKTLSVLLALLLAHACVSTGAKEITASDRTAGIEANKTGKSEVSGRLGFPAIVTYGEQGQETWEYYYVTEYPQAPDFIPVVNAMAPELRQSIKVLTVTFDRQGLVKNLERRQLAGSAAVNPY